MSVLRLLPWFLLIFGGSVGCGRPEPSVAMQMDVNPATKDGTADAPVAALDGLQWKFREGSVYRWSPTWGVDLDLLQGANHVRIETTTTLDFDITPLLVTADRSELQFTLVRCRNQTKSLPLKAFEDDKPELIVVEYDSLKDGRGTTFDSYHLLLGMRFVVHVHPSGRISEIDVDPELVATLELLRDRRTLSLLFKPESLNSFYFNGLIELPSETTAINDEWKSSITSPVPVGLSHFQMNFTVQYAGLVAPLERFTIQPTFEFDQNTPAFFQFGEQKSDGEMFFDRLQGLMVWSRWEADNELLDASGQAVGRMVMRNNSTFRMKTSDDKP